MSEKSEQVVVASRILPAARELPANVLRFYVEFSEPAEADFDRDQVRLSDGAGRVINDAFLLLGQELWSPDARRLTLLMEPGRIKRGMGADPSHFPVFYASQEYQLDVLTGGRPLHKRFMIEAAQLKPLNEADWELTCVPRARSRDHLQLKFDRVMDSALVADEIAVLAPTGRLLATEPQLSECGRNLKIVPRSLWEDGAHRLIFSKQLEDVCGNRLGEALDHALSAERFRAKPGSIVFNPRTESGRESYGWDPAGMPTALSP